MATCTEHRLDVDVNEEPIIGDSTTVNDVLLYVAIAFTAGACLLSFTQIFRHANNYTSPLAQKQIIRILFMVPVYSISCMLSIIYYREHVYIAAGFEFYESLVIAAFFILMCQHIRPEWTSLRRVFNALLPKKWWGPLGNCHCCIRRSRKRLPSSGLKWFNIVSFCILQFVIVKFFGALAKIVTEAADVYCAESNDPSHANLWIQLVELVSLAVAMLFLIQFYEQIKEPLSEQRPLLKLLSIKAVVFLFYLQTFIISRLTAVDGALQPTSTISYPSLAAGFPNAILCFEMFIVAISHVFAYPATPYLLKNARAATKKPMDEELRGMNPSGEQEDGMTEAVVEKQGGFLGWKAYLDALNLFDIIQGIGLFFRWIVFSNRRADSERLDDEFARRNPGLETYPWRTSDLKEAMARA